MENKIQNLFDDDYTLIHDNALKYGLICIVICIIMVILFFVKKEYKYSNTINFIDKNRAYLVVDNKYVNDILNNNTIMINNINYEYQVLKVEDKNVYLIEIQFKIEEVITKENTYSIKLKNESLIKYIIRIMKGE